MIKVNKNIHLAKYSTLFVGGVADFLVEVSNKGEFIEALEYAKENGLKFVVIGSGTNCLISDKGFRGLVIVNRDKQFEIHDETVVASSGVILIQLVKSLLSKGLYGLEFATGIPGTIGGAVSGNAGANGGQISDILISAEIWKEGKLETWMKEDFVYDYRSSKIKNDHTVVVLSAIFSLRKASNSSEENEISTKVASQIEADNLRRNRYYLGRTAGSYFKNPDGSKKAAELIDSLGLKGYRVGGAEVSTLHANVFRNVDSATASDFYELEKYVIQRVQEEYAITLVSEVIKIGNFK